MRAVFVKLLLKCYKICITPCNVQYCNVFLCFTALYYTVHSLKQLNTRSNLKYWSQLIVFSLFLVVKLDSIV